MPYRGSGVYRHYKGPHYEVQGVAVHEWAKHHQPGFDPNDAEHQYVVYRPLTAGGLLESAEPDFWLRHRPDFDANVAVDGAYVPRFTFCEGEGCPPS